MEDAVRLAMPDGMGGTIWKPSTLQDIHDTPARVLELFEVYRLGQMAREQPFDWWRPRDAARPEFAHQFPASFWGVPDAPARCGAPLPEGEMERTGGRFPCPKCHAMDAAGQRGEPPPGTIRFVAG